MSIRVLNPEAANKTYVFSSFWDFVVLSIKIAPQFVLRTYLYGMGGWLIGAALGLGAIEKVTRSWIIMQSALFVLMLVFCTSATYLSLRKEWDYMRKTNLVRRFYG